MHEAEGINFQLGFLKQPFTGKDERRLRKTYKSTTVDELIHFIKSRNLSIDEQKHLIKIVRTIPAGVLPRFKENYRKYLSDSIKKEKK